MTVTFVDVVSEQVPATDTTVYTCPNAVTSAQIISGNCTATTSDTLTVNLVQSGDSVAATNRYISVKNIALDISDPLSELIGLVLKAGDFISVDAVTASTLNFKLSLKEIS